MDAIVKLDRQALNIGFKAIGIYSKPVEAFSKDYGYADYGHGNLPPLPSFMPVFDEGFTTMCQRPYQSPPQIYYL